MLTSTLFILLVFTYLLICRYFRFRRIKGIIEKYSNVKLDYRTAQEVCLLTGAYDMPYVLELSTAFGLFRTYAIPTISEVLVKSNQLANKDVAGRRAEDTSVLLSECIYHDLDSKRARMGLARINYLHNLYRCSITNDDMLYTLSIFIYEPVRWSELYDWRPLEPIEKEARYIFWKEIGERMGIEYIPSAYEELEIWKNDYEKEHMIFSKTNKICGEATLNLMTSIYPVWMQGFIRNVLLSIVDERLRLAMDFEKPPTWIKRLTITIFRIRAFLLRHCALPRIHMHDNGQGPTSCPMNEHGRFNRTSYIFEPWYVKETWLSKIKPFVTKRPSPEYKSQGFTIEEVGPEKFAGKGFEEIQNDAEKMLQRAMLLIINQSETPVTFQVDLASQHVNNRLEQENKNVWDTSFDSNKHFIGPQNLSGRSVFDITPLDGVIPAGAKKQLTVSCSPDHDSDFFSDLVRITISEQPIKLEFRLRGTCRQNSMYIRPLDNGNIIQKCLLPNVNEIITTQMQTTDPNEKGIPNNILVSLCAQSINGKYLAAQRELIIGCASSSVGSKKNGDYTFDNLKDINAEGFNVDVPKSAIEMGTEKVVKITWTPTANFDPNETCRATINVTTKGDIVKVWRVILVGYVEITSSADKRSSRTSKNPRVITTDTRSHVSVGGTSQRLVKQVSTQENNQSTLTT
ncbi:unnamed protein product [Rotaria magnacalcarata]|uniref:ER-bound oxygenase mpaB/mpaB'/Rubber oxygenase catalytic domain-containing protein n=3 Tax=Rotaria magnacalcarata TaxID=392030 RepID=A0A819CFT2_9BILA|nr:unnamed protein product [Rotaria magnacalcarata]CAF2244940.1 unnamed protein product [Rotaria magnacalcarata]CAF3817288.1 unnamed protein product [Rotaria magnacalcarata]CAF3879640.1 unnamed protein product [Rotaria magnacalcarata]